MSGWRDLRAAVAWHRRLLAAGLAAASVAVGLSVVAPAPPPAEEVLVAARDLAPGAPLAERDLAVVTLPPAAVPAGALRPGAAALGRVPAGPVRRGEPLTDVRLVGPGLLDALGDGLVATPVRIADAGSVALLRAGDRVDVLAARSRSPVAPHPGAAGGTGADGTGADGTDAAPVVRAAPVLSVPAVAEGAGLADGALLVLATDEEAAAALAAAAVDGALSVVLRSGP